MLARDVVPCRRCRLALGQGNEPQGGVSRRVAQRTLECRESLAQHVRLARVELRREAVESLAIGALQVHLHRFGHAPAAARTFMITFHEFMIHMSLGDYNGRLGGVTRP